MKWIMVNCVREVCGSVRVGKQNKMWWKDTVKAGVERKEVFGARNEAAKERCIETHKEWKGKFKMCIYQSKKEVNEQFGRKMNQDIGKNRKLFRKEMGKVNEGKVENSSRIKAGNVCPHVCV